MRATLTVAMVLSTLLGSRAYPATFASRFDPVGFVSLGTLQQSSGTIEFDTDSLTVTGFPNGVLATSQSGLTSVAVYAFDSISLTDSVTIIVTGSRPIALLSKSGITLAVQLRVDGGGASGATGGAGGPGGYVGGNAGFKGTGPGAGEYTSGDAGGGGGYGGAGGQGTDAAAGGPAYGDASLTEIAGGSGGAGGSGTTAGGGGGGGSIELSAVTSIVIEASGLISASGGEGFTVSSNSSYYPGGGGSGGAVLLNAPAVDVKGSILATGGDGGDGSASGAMDGGGGGGGGRVAIYADAYASSTISVAGGLGGTAANPGFTGATGTIHIHTPAPPIATNANGSVLAETPLQITLGATDDGEPNPPAALTYVVLTLPAHGTLADPASGPITSVPYALAAEGNVVTYTPGPAFAGRDSFTFNANDGGSPPGGGDSNTATVSINVIGCFVPPVPSGAAPAEGATEVPLITQLTWSSIAISGEKRTESQRQELAARSSQNSPQSSNADAATVGDYPTQTLEATTGNIQILAFKGHSDNAAGGEYENTLNAIAQHFTDFSVTATTTETPAGLAAELVGKNVFLVPEQESWTASAFSAWGTSIASVLQSFTDAGGVVIVADDGYGTNISSFVNSTGLMTLGTITGSYTARSCTVLVPGHPVMDGLPGTFSALSGNTSFSGTTNGTVLAGESTNAVVVAREVGAGGIVVVGFDFYQYNSEMARVIANAVQWRQVIRCPATYDVLFGTENPPTTLLCNDTLLPTCTPGPLARETTYYWQVVTTNAAGTTSGPVWSFTTIGCPAPPVPATPTPADGATDVKIDADLSWAAGLQTTVAETTFAPVVDPNLAWWETAKSGDWCATEERYAARMQALGASLTAALCGTQGVCDQPAQRDLYVPNASTPMKTYRLSFHVFCEDSGANCAATQASVDGQVATLNADYLPWHIQFVYETEFINSTQFRYWTSSEEGAMKSAYADSPTQKLNIYVVNNSESYSVGTFPWDPDALTYMGGIVMHEPMFGPGVHTLTHEVGHNIGLWHTHHGVSEVSGCSDCHELAGGANGDTTGDFCSQTSPTPVNYNCAAPGGTDSCNGIAWGTTDYHNYMSYSPSSCRTEFESQQAGRFHCWSQEVLTGWLDDGTSDCPISYDIYLGTTDPPTTLLCQDVAWPLLKCDPGTLSYATTYYWKVVARDAKGTTQEGPVWHFTTLTCLPPPVPDTPNPANASTGVAPDTHLKWNGGASGIDGCLTTYDVFLSTTNPPTTKVGSELGVAEYDPPGNLTQLATYYWQVVAKNPVGSAPGPVWSFTPGCGLPSAPSNPAPASGANPVAPDAILTWSGSSTGPCPETYDVYLSKTYPPVTKIGSALTSPSCDPPGNLTQSTRYYWQVAATNADGTTTSPIWYFITPNCEPPTDAPESPVPANGARHVPVSSNNLSWVLPKSLLANRSDRMDVQSAVASIVEQSGVLKTPIFVSAAPSADGGMVNSQVLTQPEEVADLKTAASLGLVTAATLDVAICAADSNASGVEDVRTKLLSTGKFASVTIIDARAVTPTLAALQAFDAVLVFSETDYHDQAALGNVMADYVDGGGGVVCALFEVVGDSCCVMTGRWDSAAYYVIPRGTTASGSVATLGTIYLPTHPLIQGVTHFSGGSASFRPLMRDTTTGTTLVANWSDGTPLVATKTIEGTRRVDLGFYPPSSSVDPNWWDATTDGAMLMANALTYVAGGDPCAITYDVFFDTVNPPVTKIRSDLNEPPCRPALQSSKTYYWKVCAKNKGGWVCGPVWSFTTEGCIQYDSDEDGDVDQNDAATFQGCLSGPAQPHSGGSCTRFDSDSDEDIDQEDFGAVQRCISGTGIPADPNCY